ncbi:hypothetical protein CC1G_03050 [Coprinopsis cinerea okayama7|uniref:BTB domain-containing protein n=1 Tax=Coprinopsis cinerea (strain Okayama-7 / 130 / ATCC MYA-4618 / FGSC 9003) TaxID=240176 RepID=A8PEQ5_COPC7|nr:hypothetical protein CC1G_03050 [Coprinopsis cinerea okayama7\|eukprot:XP_001840821.2 hypothetical protein CC1G_03050 [Coprinopsis cinerea okayama7\
MFSPPAQLARLGYGLHPELKNRTQAAIVCLQPNPSSYSGAHRHIFFIYTQRPSLEEQALFTLTTSVLLFTARLRRNLPDVDAKMLALKWSCDLICSRSDVPTRSDLNPLHPRIHSFDVYGLDMSEQTGSSSLSLLAKRKRVEGPDGASPDSEPIQRAKTWWFDDGNVIIQAEKVQFRVHRGVLSYHSAILSTMFSLPQPSTNDTSTETVEGCPVVPVSDSAMDWDAILRVFYSSVLFLNGGASPPLEVVFAMIRLGHKYDMPHCRNEGIRLIRSACLSTPNFSLSPSLSISDLVQFSFEMRLETVQARLFLYTVENPGFPEILYRGTTSATGKTTQISPSLHPTLTLGREKLWAEMQTHLFSYLFKNLDSAGCHDTEECSKAKLRITCKIFTPVPQLGYILTAWDPDLFGKDLCKHCLAEAKATVTEGQYTMMKLLPKAFGLPPWECQKDLNF